VNIFYINHYAGSLKHGMEFRPFYLSRDWTKQGHNVTVVAASYAHVRSNQPKVSKIFTHEIIDGINYIWCKTPTYKANGTKRFLNMLVFVTRLFQLIFTLNNKPSVVIASSTYPLDIFPAYLIAKRYKAKLIFEVHDLWPLSPIEIGKMSKWHPFIILIQAAEDFAYKHSNLVISILPKTLDYMKTRGLNSNKFIHIPNGIDLTEWNISSNETIPSDIRALQLRIKRDQHNGFFTISYLGSHGPTNALTNLIESIALLKNKKISVYLIGGGPEKNSLIAFAKTKNLENIYFENPIPKKYVPIISNSFDANYIGLQKQPLFKFGISPNKMMDYMAAGKPIISAIESGNNPVLEANCGLSVAAEDPKQLAEAIDKLSQLSEDERMKMGENGRRHVYKEHDYTVLAKKFLESIKS